MSRADDLEFHVLACLTQAIEERRYGWQIQYWLKEQLGLRVRVTSIYRILKRFHDNGWTDRRQGEQNAKCPGLPRQYYTLSPAGLARFRTEANKMTARAERLKKSAKAGLRGVVRGKDEGIDRLGGARDAG